MGGGEWGVHSAVRKAHGLLIRKKKTRGRKRRDKGGKLGGPDCGREKKQSEPSKYPKGTEDRA